MNALKASHTDVYVGKVILSTRKKGWQVNHWKDYSVLTRIKVIETSGIRSRWQSLLEGSEKMRAYSTNRNASSSSPTFAGSDMKGNFSAIFILLVVCMSLSSIAGMPDSLKLSSPFC